MKRFDVDELKKMRKDVLTKIYSGEYNDQIFGNITSEVARVDSFKDRPEELRAEIEKLVKFLNERFPSEEDYTYPYVY